MAGKRRTDTNGRPKRVTLQDIAREAGVHVMTVSDALNGTRRVAPATRERVRRIAQELNYVPNSAARALVTGRTGVIAVLNGILSEPYYANMAHLIEVQLAASGYKMMLLRTRQDVQSIVDATSSFAVDGIIAVAEYHYMEEFFRLGNERVRSCVFVDTSNPDFVDHVTLDLTRGATQALDMMVAAGRKRIAYLMNEDGEACRREAYESCVAKLGREPEFISVDSHLPPRERTNSIRDYLRRHGCPEGLFCHNDETAMYAYHALFSAGYRIPDDVLLVGFDGLPHMECFNPPLSTVAHPMEEMCALAWQFLQQRMAAPDAPFQSATVHSHLLARASLGVEEKDEG